MNKRQEEVFVPKIEEGKFYQKGYDKTIYSPSEFTRGVYNKLYKTDLKRDDFKALQYAFGKDFRDKILVSRGKNASNIIRTSIKALGRLPHFSDTYVLTGTVPDDKAFKEYKRKTNSLVEGVLVAPLYNPETGEYKKDENGKIVEYKKECIQEVESRSYIKRALPSSRTALDYNHFLMVDLDCHSSYEVSENDAVSLWKRIRYQLLEDNFVLPHIVVYTGRGLQLWYLVNRYDPNHEVISELAAEVLRRLKESFVVVLAKLRAIAASSYNELSFLTKEEIKFQKDNDLINHITVDMSTSAKRQLVRLPGTINFKSGTVARVIEHNTSQRRYVLSEALANLDTFEPERKFKEYVPNRFNSFYKSKKRQVRDRNQREKLKGRLPEGIDSPKHPSNKKPYKKPKRTNHYKHDFSEIIKRRIHDDILLLKHRGVGNRHNSYVRIILNLMDLKKTDEEIFKYVDSLDREEGIFFYMRELQLKNHIESCRRFHEQHKSSFGTYMLTNKKIEEEWYGITEDEYQTLDFRTYGKIKSEATYWENRRVEKFNLAVTIVKAYLHQTKKNISELARTFKKARNTIYTYIEKYWKQTLKILKEEGLQKAKHTQNRVNRPLTSLLLCRNSIDNLNTEFLNSILHPNWKFNGKLPFPTQKHRLQMVIT